MESIKQLLREAIACIMYQSLKVQSIRLGFAGMEKIVETLHVDLAKQYTKHVQHTPFRDIKMKNQQAFQVDFTRAAIEKYILSSGKEEIHVVDIGDSAGTHIKKLRKLMVHDNRPVLHAVSVNLDPVAVDKIARGGGEAVCCRAEDYVPDNSRVDMYLSYEMVEHLHNPALFFHHLAQADKGDYMIITVPYVTQSRVALCNSMNGVKDIHAEWEHVFELSPEDWKKLILHSGWQTLEEKVYFQYPTGIPGISYILRKIWARYDFEGFIGFCLKRDMSVANEYLDWED